MECWVEGEGDGEEAVCRTISRRRHRARCHQSMEFSILALSAQNRWGDGIRVHHLAGLHIKRLILSKIGCEQAQEIFMVHNRPAQHLLHLLYAMLQHPLPASQQLHALLKIFILHPRTTLTPLPHVSGSYSDSLRIWNYCSSSN